MLKRWLSNVKTWLAALEGIDDVHGDYLLRLEQRVRDLEVEVQALRSARSAADRGDDAATDTNLSMRSDEQLRA